MLWCIILYIQHKKAVSSYNLIYFKRLGSKVFWGSLRCFDVALTFVLFSVAYKHINGKGVITLYSAQTGLP